MPEFPSTEEELLARYRKDPNEPKIVLFLQFVKATQAKRKCSMKRALRICLKERRKLENRSRKLHRKRLFKFDEEFDIPTYCIVVFFGSFMFGVLYLALRASLVVGFDNFWKIVYGIIRGLIAAFTGV